MSSPQHTIAIQQVHNILLGARMLADDNRRVMHATLNLFGAQIILLLVSASFVASDYCFTLSPLRPKETAPAGAVSFGRCG